MANVIEAGALPGHARSLVPLLAARAVETETLRRLPDLTVADLKAAGLHRMCQPRRFGGAEAPLDTAVATVATLAEGCASTGWVTGVWADHQIILGMFPDRAADDVWRDDPDRTVSAGLMPSGTGTRMKGGWRIAGKWGFSSGCDHAAWFLLGTRLPADNGGPGISFCLVPRSDIVIDDNWHVMGMSGTGSKNIVVEEAFVPDHRAMATALIHGGEGMRRRTGVPPLYRLPHGVSVPFLLAAPSIGVAQSLLDLHLAAFGASAGRGSALAELPTMQMHVAEAAAEIDSARLLAQRATSEAMATMAAGEDIDRLTRARNWRDKAYVVTLCRRAVNRLFVAEGAHGLFNDGAAQRKFRDMQAIAGHFALNWDIGGTVYGKVAFGLEPGPGSPV